MVNAAEALDGQGQVEVRLRQDQPGVAVLEVHDDGPGVPEELRHRIFDALYTTKPQGTGLGMIAVRACASAHGGAVALEQSPLGGALFRLSLHQLSAQSGPQVEPSPAA